jgi:L-ribulose-5-phosphate 3-epimerase
VTRIAFMTANYVARETGFAMRGWGHGDRTTNEAFAPLVTYEERFESLCRDIRALGFDTVDVWGAHLNPDWATDEHLGLARAALDRNELAVSTYATWVGPPNAERACDLATGLGTDLIGAGFSGDRDRIAAVLRGRGLRLGIENHPEERTPQDVLERIGDAGDVLGATVDTGWWGTQGFDPVRAIEALGDRILHVHLKDVRAVGEPHETCRWGEGIVDVEGCVRALQRIGYAGALSVEHEPEMSDPTEDVRAMRAQLEGWLA